MITQQLIKARKILLTRWGGESLVQQLRKVGRLVRKGLGNEAWNAATAFSSGGSVHDRNYLSSVEVRGFFMITDGPRLLVDIGCRSYVIEKGVTIRVARRDGANALYRTLDQEFFCAPSAYH